MSCVTNCKRQPTGQDAKEICLNRMSDGRAFTDYRSSCSKNIYSDNQEALSTYDKRMYLMNNAEKLIESDRQAMYACEACFDYSDPKVNGTTPPNSVVQKCNDKFCTFKTVDNAEDNSGFGVNRNFANGRTAY